MLFFVSRNVILASLLVTLFYSISVVPHDLSQKAQAVPNYYIPLISHRELLTLISKNKRVVFVDSRESPEFLEEQIPGAYNLPLRNVSAKTAQQFSNNDIVIAYCLKDFRGFEVAKALKSMGVNNVYTMTAPGLNGWKNVNLPLNIPSKQAKGLALKQLQQCANALNLCIGVNDA